MQIDLKGFFHSDIIDRSSGGAILAEVSLRKLLDMHRTESWLNKGLPPKSMWDMIFRYKYYQSRKKVTNPFGGLVGL